jgi:hypothetical protein
MPVSAFSSIFFLLLLLLLDKAKVLLLLITRFYRRYKVARPKEQKLALA